MLEGIYLMWATDIVLKRKLANSKIEIVRSLNYNFSQK